MAAVLCKAHKIQLNRYIPVLFRAISTSKKNSDTIVPAVNETQQQCEKVAAQTKSVEKNWVSYGFDFQDKAADRRYTHLTFFVSITLFMVFGGFAWAYMPDYQLRDWAQREAYLELRRREANGLPLVDPNLIDPANIQLPDDEELTETEIII